MQEYPPADSGSPEFVDPALTNRDVPSAAPDTPMSAEHPADQAAITAAMTPPPDTETGRNTQLEPVKASDTPGRKRPSDPSPKPQELIADLDLRTLEHLGNIVQGDWSRVVMTEQRKLENALDAVRVYVPEQLESPPLEADEGGVQSYLTAARDAHKDQPPAATREKFVNPRAITNALAKEYLQAGAASRLEDTGVPADRLAELFASNLGDLTLLARRVARQTFDTDRNASIRGYFPGVPLVTKESFLETLRDQPITTETVAQVRANVERITSYVAPYPDFLQMTEAQQQEIVTTLGAEWEEMCRIVHTHAPNLLGRSSTRDTSPLAYLSTDDLRQAIASNPEIDPRAVCEAFLREPNEFYGQVDEFKREATERAAAELAAREGAALEALTPNQAALHELLEHPDIVATVQAMEFGDTIALTGDTPVSQRKLSEIVDIHLQLLARTMYETMPENESGDARLVRWNKIDLADELRAGFQGTLRNLSITKLPVTQEVLERRLASLAQRSHVGIRADEVMEVALSVFMKSSGRPGKWAVLRGMLIVEPMEGTIHEIAKSAWRTVSTGTQYVDQLKAEAEEIARTLEVNARRHPYQGGLPGRGKRPNS